MGLPVLNLLEILVWAEHSLERAGQQLQHRRRKMQMVEGLQDTQGCSWSLWLTLSDKSRLKVPPWHVLAGRERTRL